MEAPRTRVVRAASNDPRILELRKKRIREAVAWEAGPSLDQQIEYVVYPSINGAKGGFRKPGKEKFRKPGQGQARPNVHDMQPFVGEDYTGATFQDSWVMLSKLAIRDFEGFRTVLALLYRLSVFADHSADGERVWYNPEGQVRTTVDALQEEFKGDLPPTGLMGLLCFLDLLAWNEDVKYHADRETGVPRFEPPHWRYRNVTGPETFIGTCIRVTYETAHFVLKNPGFAPTGKQIDFSPPYGLLQQMARTRGVCTPTQRQLVEWLAPHITT